MEVAKKGSTPWNKGKKGVQSVRENLVTMWYLQ